MEPAPSLPFAVRCIRLTISLALISIVWLLLLPWLARQSVVAEHIATQQRLEIDPSAMFYTELKIANPIASHVERLHDSYSTSFWRSSAAPMAASRLEEPRNRGPNREVEIQPHQ